MNFEFKRRRTCAFFPFREGSLSPFRSFTLDNTFLSPRSLAAQKLSASENRWSIQLVAIMSLLKQTWVRHCVFEYSFPHCFVLLRFRPPPNCFCVITMSCVGINKFSRKWLASCFVNSKLYFFPLRQNDVAFMPRCCLEIWDRLKVGK